MIKFKLLRKTTVVTLLFFAWFSMASNFNFAQEKTEDDFTTVETAYKSGDYDTATEILNNVIEKSKHNPKLKKKLTEAYYWLAKINFDFGKIQEAETYLDKALCIDISFKKEGEKPEFNELVEKRRAKMKVICQDGTKKKKKTWLIFAGVVVVAAAIILLTGKKKKETNYTLTVNKGEGVDGNPGTGSHSYSKGSTVSYNYSLQSGYTSLIVTLDGNVVPASGTITMNSDHQLNAVTTELGSISVTSDPAGARIYLDNQDTGQTTDTVISNVLPGTHTLRLSLAGYASAERTVDVSPGEQKQEHFDLEKTYTNSITINSKLGTKATGEDENTGHDAFRFYVESSCRLTITVSADNHISPEYALFANADASGNALVSESGNNSSITYSVSTSGQYFSIGIEDETFDQDERAGSYTITITADKNCLGDYVQIKDEAPEILSLKIL